MFSESCSFGPWWFGLAWSRCGLQRPVRSSLRSRPRFSFSGERERERVPTSPTTGRWTAHTLRPVTLQAWPVKHRNHLPTLASTDRRSKEPDTLCKRHYYVSIHSPLLVILFLVLFSKLFPLLTSGNDVKKSTFQTGKSGQVCWCISVDTRIIAKFK